jgi:hypothetical protein
MKRKEASSNSGTFLEVKIFEDIAAPLCSVGTCRHRSCIYIKYNHVPINDVATLDPIACRDRGGQAHKIE